MAQCQIKAVKPVQVKVENNPYNNVCWGCHHKEPFRAFLVYILLFSMNRIILALTFFSLITLVPAKAQDYNIRLGGGLIYGTSQNNIGVNLRGDISFFSQWSITPGFNMFFNKKNNLITKKWNAFNVDGHYYFELDRLWTIYPTFGINFATVSEKVNDITFSNAEIGINIGFGSEYRFDSRLSGFAEIKYVISDADQAVIVFGMLYQINK